MSDQRNRRIVPWEMTFALTASRDQEMIPDTFDFPTISGAQTTLEVVSGALDAVGAAQEGHEAAQILKSGEKECDRN